VVDMVIRPIVNSETPMLGLRHDKL